MNRVVEVASLFLGFGLIGVGGDFASAVVAEALSDRDEHGVVDPRIEVDVQVSEPDVEVSIRAAASGACAFEAERSASLPASVANVLRVSAGSGELSVRGQEGLDQVRVVARACASRAEALEDLQITLENVGADIVLSAHYPEGSRSLFGDNYARLDLVVEVPLAMAAEIEDGSGAMEVAGTGALTVRDSSGEIVLSDVRGPVDVVDSSGEIELVSAAGTVTVHDGSGEIRIENVVGNVEIEDGSGEIALRLVRGDVRIRDGSGSIDARQVEGSVTVDGDGSGAVDVSDVTGDFSVLRGGSGSISHSGVGGRVDVPVRRGRRGDG